jgi:regulator of protease activity HflC (stomatin/prohibitin superfamily)
MKLKKGQSVVAGIVIISLIVVIIGTIIILAMGFDTVDASHRGIMIEFGKTKGTMEPGIKWTGLFTDTIQYSLRTRKLHVDMLGQDSAVDKDGQSVYASIDINYRLKYDAVEKVYQNIGRDNNLEEILNIQGIIKEGFKTTTSQYASLEIFQKREEVKQKAIDQIRKNFPSEYFDLETVIVSNIDYNPAFKAAIEAKKVAEETAKAKEQEVFVNKFEADKAIENARGIAESAKLAAEAEAYTIKVNAESKAYSTIEIAKAEAEGLRLKKAELTPLMVQNNYIDMLKQTWGGNYPQWITGESANFIFEVPSFETLSN